MKLKSFIIYLFTVISFFSLSQTTTQTAESIINDIFEQYTAESDETIDYESFYNDLISLTDNPLNLNTASREELEKLAFLSDIQIENILAYIYKNAQLNTIYELQLIEGIDMTDIRNMLPFVQIGKKDNVNNKIYGNEIFKYGKSDVMFRIDKGLEKKNGYIKNSNSQGISSSEYYGAPIYNSLKYNFNFKNRIQFGATMEKDAGEQFWGTKHKGYDFYSFYFQGNNIGKLKTIVAGNFRASFGQGLVFNSGFGSSKSSYTLNVVSRDNGLKKFSSTDETSFFKGVGGTFKLRKTEISLFYSNKKMDTDTLSGSFKSFTRTGLHRTESEIDKKHSVTMQTIGVHTTTNLGLARIGFTAAHTLLSDTLLPEKAPYNLNYYSGLQQTSVSTDYRVRLGTFNLFGETALTNNKGIAAINGVLFSPTSTVSIVTVWRYYSPKYDTFYANAFSESTRVNNETGMYIGTEIRPFSRWKISAYADSYRFPWLKYGVNAPSSGQDYLLQTEYNPKRNMLMNWRIKFEQKQKNSNNLTISSIEDYAKGSIRYQLMYISGNFATKNLIEISYSDSASTKAKIGFAAYQDLSYTFRKIPLSVDFRCMLFDAPNYDNRFYLYEKDILYAFSIPMFYGLGMRYYLNLKYELTENCSFWFKIAQTVYGDNRTTISSGNEEIQGNKKTDIRFMVRYRF
jgi:hypothetical protein